MKNWQLHDTDFREAYQLNETLFSTANGYLGVRGSFEEGVPENIPSVRGAYINGFYESETIQYGEKLHGFPDRSQSILNVIDTQEIQIFIDGEGFSLFEGTVLSYNRVLDFREGVATRTVQWQSPKGKTVNLTFKRLVSFVQRELFLMDVTIEALDFEGEFSLISTIEGNVSNIVAKDDPRVGTTNAKGLAVQQVIEEAACSYVIAATDYSQLTVVGGIEHRCSKKIREVIEKNTTKITHHFSGTLAKGEVFQLTKYAVYTDTRRHPEELSQNKAILNASLKEDFAHFSSLQAAYLADFWEHATVQIDGDDQLQQGIRFNMFHLLQSVGKDRWSNISAKGLSGEGYEGHYFWDTEIYIFPFFLFTNPALAKGLLEYRYSILEAARKRARQMGHPIGVLYPWRTIAGDECSPFFPAGTAQYHINVDVAYSLIQYYTVTEDTAFMLEKGLEILVEISRLMYHIGHFRSDGKFGIDAVTGPDEYTCIVNNNYYTNVLTKNLFERTVAIFQELEGQWDNNIRLTSDELSCFEKAGTNMYLPYNEDLDMRPQDDSFLNKKVWDFENTPKEHYPLLLHYHPLTLYRHQVCKQADTILGHFLMESASSLETIKNDYHYYEKITTHDSSLSTCVFSIMANRIGEHEKAYDYFMNTSRLDIDNLHHNTKDGIHTACMGGSWMSLVFGFAGMRVFNGELHFHPHLPKKWQSLAFSMVFKGRQLTCSLEKKGMTVSLEKGAPLTVWMNGIPCTLERYQKQALEKN